MKTSKAIIIASAIILLAAIIFALSNRYYITGGVILDRLTGDTYLVRDRLKGTPTPTPSHEPSGTPRAVEDARSVKSEPIDKGDFSKVVISGDAADTDNPYMYNISCTVKNNDSISHKLTVKAIFYDKNNKPILTEESSRITVKPGDIESASINVFDNVENIASYELKLVKAEI